MVRPRHKAMSSVPVCVSPGRWPKVSCSCLQSSRASGPWDAVFLPVVSVFKAAAALPWLPRFVLPGGHFCSSRQIRYFSRGTGEQTLSAELASAPQVKQETVGLSVRCAISLVNPWLFRMHRWPLWLSPQLQLMLDPMSLSSMVLISLLSIAARRRYEANLPLLHRRHRLLSACLTDDELHSSSPCLPASRYALYAFLRRCIVCYLPLHRPFSVSTSSIGSLPA